MTTLMEEMRQAVLHLWQSLGFERSSSAARTAAAAIPALAMGIVLNVAALSILGGVCAICLGTGADVTLSRVARAEVKVVRAVVVSTQDKLDDGQRRLCSAREWLLDRQAEAARLYSELRCGLTPYVPSKNVTLCLKTKLLKQAGSCQRSVRKVG